MHVGLFLEFRKLNSNFRNLMIRICNSHLKIFEIARGPACIDFANITTALKFHVCEMICKITIFQICKCYPRKIKDLRIYYMLAITLQQSYFPFSGIIRTLFKVPKQLGTVCSSFDPSRHLPSTKNLNSYLPGGKIMLTFHDPSLSIFMELAPASQLLKSPTRETSLALGAFNENVTLRL